jgi:hypothetical protein
MSGILGDLDTDLITVAPLTGPTLANLYIKLTAGRASVGGVYGRFAVQDDYDLTNAAVPFYDLTGADGAVPSADGKTYWVAVCLVVVGGVVTIATVAGDEADDGNEVEPSEEEIAAALKAAAALPSSLIEGLQPPAGGFQCGLAKVKRVAVDTITVTDTDPATDDGLAAYRRHWNIFGVASP